MIRTMQRKFRKNRGFTLVELMIVVAIVGILAALAIYGVRKYMANAKSAEAKNSIGQMAKDASNSYNKEHMEATVLTAGATAGLANALCLTGAGDPVPVSLDKVAQRKYQSAATEWDTDSATVGWQCLKFSMAEPQYYMYSYAGTATGFTATANGDLDGDGTASTFSLTGAVADGTVAIAPSVFENLAEE